MNARLADAHALTGLGTVAALFLLAVVAIVAALLVFIAMAVPSQSVVLARNVSLVFGYVVVIVTMVLLSSHLYLHYRLLSEVMDR